MQSEKIDVAYFRLSLQDANVYMESNSISSQRMSINNYVKQHNDLGENMKEFIDDGYSGTNFKRPGIQHLLKLVSENRVKTIIVKDLSRLGRNYLEVGYYLEYVFPFYNVRFISINDNFDSKNLGEQTSGFEIAIRNLINEYYSRDISRKIKSVVDSKKMNGEYVYGAFPYGYKKENKKLFVDDIAAENVKYIFRLANDGFTITQIAQRMNQEKVQTPSAYMNRKNYKVAKFWTYESIRNILLNRIYTGDTEAFKSHVVAVGSNMVKMLPEEQRPIIENTHAAIISREEYFGARKIIKSNQKLKKHGVNSILSGFLYCGCCGNKLFKGKASNKNFLCATSRYAPNAGCQNVRCIEKEMEAIIFHAIQIQVKLAGLKYNEYKKQSKKDDSQIQLLQVKVKQAQNEIDDCKSQKVKLYEQFVSGQMNKEQYVIAKNTLTEEETELMIKLRETKETLISVIVVDQENSNDKIDSEPLRKYLTYNDLTKEMIQELISKIVISENGQVDIFWNFSQENLIKKCCP